VGWIRLFYSVHRHASGLLETLGAARDRRRHGPYGSHDLRTIRKRPGRARRNDKPIEIRVLRAAVLDRRSCDGKRSLTLSNASEDVRFDDERHEAASRLFEKADRTTPITCLAADALALFELTCPIRPATHNIDLPWARILSQICFVICSFRPPPLSLIFCRYCYPEYPWHRWRSRCQMRMYHPGVCPSRSP
jgi:hypothetical protein